MTEQPQNETQEQPVEEAPEADDSAAPAARKKGSRLVDAIIVIVLVAIIGAAAFYYPEVSAFVKLRPWSKSAPRETAQQLTKAVAASDVAAIEAILNPDGLQVNTDDGKVTGISQKAAMGAPPPVTFDQLTPAGSMDEASLQYRYHAIQWGVTLEFGNAAGGTTKFRLKPEGGQWRVIEVGAEGSPGSGGPPPPSSAGDASAPGRPPGPGR